jgi:FMN reductase [NAD(P)H]
MRRDLAFGVGVSAAVLWLTFFASPGAVVVATLVLAVIALIWFATVDPARLHDDRGHPQRHALRPHGGRGRSRRHRGRLHLHPTVFLVGTVVHRSDRRGAHPGAARCDGTADGVPDVLRRRRMVRNYLEDPVDPPLSTGSSTPALAPPVPDSPRASRSWSSPTPTGEGTSPNSPENRRTWRAGFDPWISRAPVHIAVCVSEAAYHERYREPDKLDADGNEIAWPVPYWWVDAGASLMAILLAAVDEGLAAGFLGVQSFDGLADYLELPAGVTPIGSSRSGIPPRTAVSSSLDRGRRDDAIHRERWGG